jgi:hypothetical protein
METHPDTTLIAYHLVLAHLRNDGSYAAALREFGPEHANEVMYTLVHLLAGELDARAAIVLAGLEETVIAATWDLDLDAVRAQSIADLIDCDLSPRVIMQAEMQFRLGDM